jgi:hypothetical protein
MWYNKMFDYFNKPFLEKTIKNNKTIVFSQDPRLDKTALRDE